MRQTLGRRTALFAIAATTLFGLRSSAAAEETKSTAEQIVDAMNDLFGKHPGFRAFHAKGIVCEGEFTPSNVATTLSRAPHLQNQPVRATIRFSDGTGLPEIPDGFPNASPHGMAVKFHLPGGRSTDIVTNAFNGFAVADGEEFLAFFRAVAASAHDKAKPSPLDRFLASHPHASKVVSTPKPTPASFATSPYFSVHAFKFTNRQGMARFGRYQFQPMAKPKFLTDAESANQPPNFLLDELTERLKQGPAEFRLIVQLAAEGDVVDDSTQVWPDDRPTVELGILKITAKVADNDAAQRALSMDPTRVVDGIEPSDDPLLDLRAEVYAISRKRRQQ